MNKQWVKRKKIKYLLLLFLLMLVCVSLFLLMSANFMFSTIAPAILIALDIMLISTAFTMACVSVSLFYSTGKVNSTDIKSNKKRGKHIDELAKRKTLAALAAKQGKNHRVKENQKNREKSVERRFKKLPAKKAKC